MRLSEERVTEWCQSRAELAGYYQTSQPNALTQYLWKQLFPDDPLAPLLTIRD